MCELKVSACPKDEFRDGEQAVKLAQKACEITIITRQVDSYSVSFKYRKNYMIDTFLFIRILNPISH